MDKYWEQRFEKVKSSLKASVEKHFSPDEFQVEYEEYVVSKASDGICVEAKIINNGEIIGNIRYLDYFDGTQRFCDTECENKEYEDFFKKVEKELEG